MMLFNFFSSFNYDCDNVYSGGGTLFSPQYSEDRGGKVSEFKTSLVYRVSSWTARTIQRNSVTYKNRGVGVYVYIYKIEIVHYYFILI